MNIINIDVSENDSGRLDSYVATKTHNISRTQIKNLIKEGLILVNEEFKKSSYIIKHGDSIIVKIPEKKEPEILAEDLNLDIIYEDDDLCIINKPKGMVIHPATGNYTGTLVNGLLYQINSLSDIGGEIRPGIVHRLDKDTSGTLVVAKHNEAHKYLANQFKNRSVERKYVALVHGIVSNDKGIIDGPIGRHPVNRKRMAVTGRNSKEARTFYKVIERYNNHTLIELQLETGRTHQIRVHMEYINHPIVGDSVYSRRKNEWKINKQILHAKKLGFKHPSNSQYMEFEINLPEYLKKIVRNLKHKRIRR